MSFCDYNFFPQNNQQRSKNMSCFHIKQCYTILRKYMMVMVLGTGKQKVEILKAEYKVQFKFKFDPIVLNPCPNPYIKLQSYSNFWEFRKLLQN